MKKISKILFFLILFLGTVACTNDDERKTIKFDEVDEKYVEEKLGEKDFILVDARHNSYYIGNLGPSVNKGGHIAGAIDFSKEWLDIKDVDDRLKQAIKDKGLDNKSEVVVYSVNEESDRFDVAHYLYENGIENIKVFNATSYINSKHNMIESYENYEYFIPAYGLNEIVQGRDYQGIDARSAKFFEVSWGDESISYANGHIPNSVHINTDEIESPPLWSLNTTKELLNFLSNNGIMKDDTIILSGSNGNMAPSRLAVILRYLGVDNVYILNGGTESFVSAGYELETDSHSKMSSKTDIIIPLNDSLIDTIDEVKQIIARDDATLVDIRTKDEWLGNDSGYSDLEHKGRIKGAVFHGGNKGETPGDVYDYTNVDGTMRNFDEVLEMWESAGIDYNNDISLYCGSGWRTAEVLMYANTYGLDNVSMYSNGWYEWSSIESQMVEKGE